VRGAKKPACGYLEQLAQPEPPGQPLLSVRLGAARLGALEPSMPLIEETMEIVGEPVRRPMEPPMLRQTEEHPLVNGIAQPRVAPLNTSAISQAVDVPVPPHRTPPVAAQRVLSTEPAGEQTRVEVSGDFQERQRSVPVSKAPQSKAADDWRDDRVLPVSAPPQPQPTAATSERIASAMPEPAKQTAETFATHFAEPSAGSSLLAENESAHVDPLEPGPSPKPAAAVPDEPDRPPAMPRQVGKEETARMGREPQMQQPPGKSAAAQGPRVHIGTIEIRTAIPQPPVPPAERIVERRAPAGAPQRLARGLAWRYGLVQG
jgi:hypothetical protein